LKKQLLVQGDLYFFIAKYIPPRTSGYSNYKKYSFIKEATTGVGGLIFFTANYIPPRASGYSNDKNQRNNNWQRGINIFYGKLYSTTYIPGTPTIKNILAPKKQLLVQGG
jgi:hypothetical protein